MTIDGLLAALRAITVDATSVARLAGDTPVAAVAYDSRRVTAGSVFVALRGLKADGTTFVPQAVARGAEPFLIVGAMAGG